MNLRMPDGREIYIEPMAHSISRGSTLLAGVPNYSYPSALQPDQPPTMNGLLGVIVTATREVVPISNPVKGTPFGIRALPRTGGGWDVVFAEVDSGHSFPDQETVHGLWHGVVTREGWVELTTIPRPQELPVRAFTSTQLVRRADTLFWALPYRSSRLEGAVLFVRDAAGWSHERIDVEDIHSVALFNSSTTGLELLFTRGGISVPGLGHLHLYRRNGKWDFVRQLVDGATDPVFHIAAMGGGIDQSTEAITWELHFPPRNVERREVRTMLNPFADSPPEQVLLNRDALSFATAHVPGIGPLWAVQSAEGSDGRARLHFHNLVDGRISNAGSIADPYTGPFSMAASSDSTVELSGPLLRPTDANAPLVTQLLTLRLGCAPR